MTLTPITLPCWKCGNMTVKATDLCCETLDLSKLGNHTVKDDEKSKDHGQPGTSQAAPE